MYLDQLLACIDVLLRHCDLDCGTVSLQLLQVLITVQSLSVDPHLSDKVRKLATVTIFCQCGKTVAIPPFNYHVLIVQTDR